MRHVSRSVGVLVVILVSLLGLVLPSSAAQEATPAPCPATTPEDNATLITALYAAVAADADVAAFLAAEHTVHLPSGRDEVSDVAGWANEYQEDFADLTITAEQVIAQDDLVVAYTTWRGTHQDDDEVRGYPATGRDAEWVQSTVFRIACGEIVEVWPVVDTLGRLTDLGVISDEEVRSIEGMATPTP